MCCVPGIKVWSVGYITDSNVRARINTLPLNLSSIISGFASEFMTLLIGINGVFGAFMAGIFISFVAFLSTLAVVFGVKYPYHSPNANKKYVEIAEIN